MTDEARYEMFAMFWGHRAIALIACGRDHGAYSAACCAARYARRVQALAR